MKKIVGFALLVFLCSFGCLFLDDRLRLEGVKLSALEREIAVLERECDEMALEIASATTPQAVALQAEALGMVLASEDDRAWLLRQEEDEEPQKEEPAGDVFDVVGDLLRRGI